LLVGCYGLLAGHVFHLDENGTKESLFGATYHLVGYKLPELVKGKAEAR